MGGEELGLCVEKPRLCSEMLSRTVLAASQGDRRPNRTKVRLHRWVDDSLNRLLDDAFKKNPKIYTLENFFVILR